MTKRDDLLGRLESGSPSYTGPSMIPRQPTNVELVDAAIAEATGELQAKRQEEWDQASEMLRDGVKSISHWERKVGRVLALHQRYRDVEAAGDDDSCAHCNQLTGHRVPWPCPTIKALEAT